jgi:hypothetical protein
MMTTKKPKRGLAETKRNRPANVDASKPVNSPKRKKKKAGPVGVIQQPLADDDDDEPVPAPVRRPQPRLRKAPAATSNLASHPEDTEDEKRQHLAIALIDADANVARAAQSLKEQGELARRMLADQNRDDTMESSEEEDAESDGAVEVPAPKRGSASKVRECRFVQI